MKSDVEGELPKRFGRYLLLKRMAVGGMAEVYLAVEETEHAGRRFVSVKRIRPDHAQDQDFIEFFLTEGRISLKCSHPNLPQAYELDVAEGLHYLALEYIRGHTLLDVVRAAAAMGRVPSVGTVLRIGAEIAAALEHAHALRDVDGEPLGVIHRDVSPQNVMIASSGAVKLIDFGIVRSTVQTHQTQHGVVKGKLSYVAPEMLDGRGRVDQRADLFALGVVLHEALIGRSLFRGRDDAETIERLKKREVPDPSVLRRDVPPAFAAVLLKLLERQPRRRFQSATELLAALEEVAEACGIPHSLTRLRDEVLAFCGKPPLPTLDRSILEALGQPEPEPEPDHLADGSDTEGDRVPEGLSGRLAQDPKLVYFLDRAGTPARKRRRQTTHDDPDLAELLERLS